jgi:hypothetical protein
VVEQYPGTGSTDFWGVSFAFSTIDQQEMSGEALERELVLMRACWAFFDDVCCACRLRCSGVREAEGEIGTALSAIPLPQSWTGRRNSTCARLWTRC